MNKTPLEGSQKSRRQDGATYTCADGVRVRCGYEVFETEEDLSSEMDYGSKITAPRYGILLRPGIPPTALISETRTSRDMKKIICGGPNKTYTFPTTITIVGKDAFFGNKVTSVKFNEGLKALEKNCFEGSGIRRLILPSSVESIDEHAFDGCRRLEYADLSAARGLKCISAKAFFSCGVLK